MMAQDQTLTADRAVATLQEQEEQGQHLQVLAQFVLAGLALEPVAPFEEQAIQAARDTALLRREVAVVA
jgi:hypothetical protein